MPRRGSGRARHSEDELRQLTLAEPVQVAAAAMIAPVTVTAGVAVRGCRRGCRRAARRCVRTRWRAGWRLPESTALGCDTERLAERTRPLTRTSTLNNLAPSQAGCRSCPG